MADALALTLLHDRVVARFAAEGPWLTAPDPEADPPVVGVPVPQTFGWREPPRQLQATSRIIWVPGDDSSGDAGTFGPPNEPGRHPARPLATLFEVATVYILGRDTSNINDERLQYVQARFLFDAFARAVILGFGNRHEFRNLRWITASRFQHGACLRVILVLQAMIPDAQVTLAPADTNALIDAGLNNPAPATSDPAFEVTP